MKKNLFTFLFLGLMLFVISCGINSLKPKEQVNKNYSTGSVTASFSDETATPANTTDCEVTVTGGIASGDTIVAIAYIKTSDFSGSIPTAGNLQLVSILSIDKTAGKVIVAGNFESGTSYTFRVFKEALDTTDVANVLKTNPSYEGAVQAGGTTTAYKLPAKIEGGNDMYFVQWEEGSIYNSKWFSTGWATPATPTGLALTASEQDLTVLGGSAEGRKFRVWLYRSY